MKNLAELYSDSLVTLTDLYQLTMAYGYWKNKTHEKNAVFHLFYRKDPFKGNYAVCAGLEYVVHLLSNWRYSASDLAYIASLKGSDGNVLFEQGFIDYLAEMRFTCSVDAIPEGTIVFANEPLLRVCGPIIQCQLLETALLNIVNDQTLIATKASRVCAAAGNDKVVEFGLRRAQGIDGGISASRACYIGGCAATSNVLAGKLFDIPVVGTHAHSWVMSFDSEEEAFEAYAQAMPNNCVFLVDTFDTVEGVKKAIAQGLKLRERGFEMMGVRLDSGDLCKLSIEARKLLDDAGFPNAQIIASNDLDEYKIAELKKAGARINSWGVGTQMVTAADQPALGGVYKLGAIEEEPGKWVEKIKLSNNIEKVTNPGILEVWRDRKATNNFFDVICNVGWTPPLDMECLLVPIFDRGKLIYTLPKISDIRKFVTEQLTGFNVDFKHRVSLEYGLANRKAKLVEEMGRKETHA